MHHLFGVASVLVACGAVKCAVMFCLLFRAESENKHRFCSSGASLVI